MKYQVQLYVLNQRMELFEDEAIIMSSKIQDVRDVSKVFTDFSHEFTIPASKINNRILRHALRADTAEIDPRAFHQASIEIENVGFRRGFILIGRGEYRSGVLNSYKIRFYGGLVALSRVMGDDYLSDLDSLRDTLNTDLSYNSLEARNTAIRSLHENATTDSNNYSICLNSYNDGLFYDSRGTTDNQIREGYRNIYFGNNTNNQESHNGYDLDQLRVSYRNIRVIEAIEDQYRDVSGNKLIRFSRGLDANGRPTDDPSLVTRGAHFFNQRRFTDLFMLMHSKVDVDDLDARPSEDLEFARVWPQMLADNPGLGTARFNGVTRPTGVFGGTLTPTDFENTNTYFNVYVDSDENGAIRSSEWYIDATITGNGAYNLELVDIDDDEFVVWSTGYTSGTFESSNVTSGDQAYQDIRTSSSGGSDQSDPPGLAVGNGQRLLFSTNRGRHRLVFRLRRAEGVNISIPTNGIQIKNVVRSRTGVFSNFELNTKVVGNTLAVGPGIDNEDSYQIFHRIPRLKILDYLTGLWKMWNLTAYVDVDSNGNNIIVTQELDAYYDSGQTIDLTEWIDSQRYTVETPTFYNPIIFKYKDPTTYAAREFFEDTGNRSFRRYGYGSLSYDSDDIGLDFELPYKEYKLELPFEQVVLTGLRDDGGSDDPSDVVFGWIVNESRAQNSPPPILHYVENVNPTVSLLAKDHTQSPVQVDTYNALTKTLIRDNIEVQSITFGQENIERLTFSEAARTGDPDASVPTRVTLFSNLYRRYIDQVFNSRARIFKVRARLPRGIMTNLQLNDTVIWGNGDYRINSIQTNTSDGRAILELISLDDTRALEAPARQEVDVALHIASFTNNLNNGTLVGNTATFVVLAAGGTEPFSYLWLKNGVIVPNEVGSTYTDSAPMPGDSYRVIVSDSAGAQVTSQTTTIRDNQPATVQIFSSVVGSVPFGGTVELSATVNDPERDPFTIEWLLDGNVIAGETSTTLTISNFAMANEGTYSARVTPTAGDRTVVTSNEITLSGVNGLSSLSLDDLTFEGSSQTATITVSGQAGVPFTLSIRNATPAGWLTETAISNVNGTIGANGMATSTLTVPEATVDVNRTAEVIATNDQDSSNVVSSGLFRQMHTVGPDGDLMVDANALVVGTMVTFSANITAGDAPFTATLYDGNPDSGGAQVEQMTANALGTITFTAIDTSSFTPGDFTYFIRVSDNDGDVVTEMETFTIASPVTYTAPNFTNLYSAPREIGGQDLINYQRRVLASERVGEYQDTVEYRGRVVTLSESFPLRVSLLDISAGTGDNDAFLLSDADGVSRPITFSITRTDVSPNVVVYSNTTNITLGDNVVTDPENQIEWGDAISWRDGRLLRVSIEINISDIEAINDSAVDAISGFDWVDGHVTTFPSTSTRVGFDFTNNIIVGIADFFSAEGEQYTIRPFVEWRETAGGPLTRIEGPLQQIVARTF